MKGRILIVDDHDLLRAGVAGFLAHQWEVVGQAKNGTEAVEMARLHSPDTVVMDLSMPGLNGIEAAASMIAHNPRIRIILFTQQLGREQVRAAFRVGIRGYVAKQSMAQELMSALEAVMADKYYVTPTAGIKELASKAGKAISENPANMVASILTPRQVEVLRLIAHGKSAKEIGVALDISSKTAEFHRNSIADELGIRTTAELTHYAIATGIVDL